MEYPNHRSIWDALFALQAEMPVIAKTKTANTGKYGYDYADLADMWTIMQPGMQKHGLIYVTPPEGDRIRGILRHVSSGDTLEGWLALRGLPPQDTGSEITYYRRYLLGCLTGVVTDKDDDAQAANAAAMARRHGNSNTTGNAAPSEAPAPVNAASGEWDGALAQAKQLRDRGVRVKGAKAQEVLAQMNQAWVGGGVKHAPKDVQDTFVALANEVKARVSA